MSPTFARPGIAAVSVLSVLLHCAASTAHAQAADTDAGWRQIFKRPAAPPPAPADNPLTADKIALGAALFADPRLSGSGERSCASCHMPERAFTDGYARARAHTRAPLLRNTPTLWNLAWATHYFWDGRAATLEAQAQGPIEAADELGGDWPTILRRLEQDAGMRARFRMAFAEEPPVSKATVLKALASYVRSLVSPPTRFDAWVEGDTAALGADELRGFRLFVGKAACVLCHVGWRLTDDRFHDIGLPGTDPGRGAVEGGTPGLAAFKTPGLRELALTAPYMHDGSLASLEAVLRHYTGSRIARPSLSANMKRNLKLSAKERADLIAFLRTLSSEQK
jgi:cytochrome c peroxidase